MNKLIILILCIWYGLPSAQAQVTILRSDFGQIGDTIRYEADTTITPGTIAIGAGGASQTWNYTSGISAEITDQSIFRHPSANPGAPSGTNISVFSNLEGIFDLQADSSKVSNLRINPLNGQTLSFRIMDFPMTFGKQFADSAQQDLKGTGAQLNFPQVDSVWYKVNIINRVTCDGWGTLTTPKGTYNVLRVRNRNEQKITVLGKGLITLYQWVPLFNQGNAETAFLFLGNNAKYYVAKAVVDSNNFIRAFSWQAHLTPPTTDVYDLFLDESLVVYPNPAGDQLTLKWNASGPVQLTLIDATGRVCMQRSGITGGLYNIDTHDLANGIYVCKVSGDSGQFRQKVLIRK